MENKNLNSYGYLLNCPDEMLGDVNKTMNDKRAIINWNNFNVGDAFYTENIYRCVMVDHVMKRIMFVTEEEYKNEFELRYNNNKYKKPDMREKIKEYIGELDTEIDRLEGLLKNTDSPYDLQIKGRLNAIIEVKNDLLGRLEEAIQVARIIDKPNKIKVKLIVEVEAEFYDDESSEETLRYCVEQDLEDAGFNVIDVSVMK